MPKRVVTTEIHWQCKMCRHPYIKKEDAVSCEAQGLALPKFKRGDIVYVRDFADSNKIIVGVIMSYGWTDDRTYPNSHRSDDCYDVNVLHRDHNPNNAILQSLFARVGLTVGCNKVWRYPLKRNVCPMCESTDITVIQERTYTPHYFTMYKLAFLKNVEMSFCGNCRLSFLTKKQSQLVDMKIRKKLGSTKIAHSRRTGSL